MIFDCIVIGKGLIGSATAKYLATEGCDVAILGPDEPEDHTQGIVFSSHYDQARIQRIIGTDRSWTMLNKKSVEAYPAIQDASGIQFHKPIGCLYVNPHGQDEYLINAAILNDSVHSITSHYSNGVDINKDFRGYRFPEGSVGLFEADPAGIINPRSLIRAQLAIFENRKGTIIKEIVDSVSRTKIGFQIKTLGGHTYRTSKILIAAGSFTNSFKLLPRKLELKVKSETTIWIKVSRQQATSLHHLPALLYEINEPQIQNIYLIPPVQYPDDNYYLKLGANMPEDIHFRTLGEIQEWFRVPCTGISGEKLERAAQLLLPGLKNESVTTKKCIISRTFHKRPYIGKMEENWYVATGGNGYSAMCSDAIGKLAALTVLNSTNPPEFSMDAFQPVQMT